MSSIDRTSRSTTRRFADDGTPAYPAAAPPAADTPAPAPPADSYVAADAEPNPFDTALENGLRSARPRLLDAAADAAASQVAGLASGSPGYTTSGRNLLREDLRLQLDASLPGGSPPAPPAPPQEGWSFSPTFKPQPRLTLDPARGPLDGIGASAGIAASGPDLRLHADVSASVDQPLTDPQLGSLGAEAGFDYGTQGAFVPGDRLGISGKAVWSATLGPQGTSQAGASVGAGYMARNVLSPGDALSIAADASLQVKDLGGTPTPDYGVHSSLTYHF